MNYQNYLLHVQIIPLHNHYIYHLLNSKYKFQCNQNKRLSHGQDKHFIKIALNIKTNYKNIILIVIQSSMPKIKYPKEQITIKPLIFG